MTSPQSIVGDATVPARLTSDRVGRALACLGIAALAAWWAFHPVPPGRHYDFGQSWFAARAVLAHQDPYLLIGHGKAFEWAAPYFYPLPAALLVTPLASFPENVAAAVFVFVGAFGLAWSVTRWGLGGLWAFASFAVLNGLITGQWSLVLSASVLLAPFTVFLAAKPTIGAAMWVARPRWSAVWIGLALFAIAFMVQPHWVSSWREALHAASLTRAEKFPYVAPVLFPGGILVLLALTRWRRWEARLLVAMALVPHTTLPYEAVPLFLIPRTTPQMLALVAMSYVGMVLVDPGALPDIATRVDAAGRVITVALYLPATIMVLRRPNARV